MALEGDGALVVAHGLEVGDRLGEVHALDGGADLAAVLVVNAEVGATAMADLAVLAGSRE